MIMDLLVVRSSGSERTTFDRIVEMATSTRPDAFDAALTEIGRLGPLKVTATRVLQHLRSIKEEHAKLRDQATLTITVLR